MVSILNINKSYIDVVPSGSKYFCEMYLQKYKILWNQVLEWNSHDNF